MGKRKKHRRRKERKHWFAHMILIIAITVFCVSAFQLLKIGKGYLDGRNEYEKIREAVTVENDSDDKDNDKSGFEIDFDRLLEINPDTVGWIRFDPEPSEISYPIVQGKDNETYLHKTFSDNENTMGAIFLNVDNNDDFSDKNSIIYGHRMKDGSMFKHLQDYDNKEFWKKNPYFYIYTTDGKKLTYHIYSVGVVEDLSDTYLTQFPSEKGFKEFLNMTIETAVYHTGVKVGENDRIVTLSTCTAASDEHRFVVRGVLESEK
ncbi:MAG: class B sortase [Lachnospiraceae bacterium]